MSALDREAQRVAHKWFSVDCFNSAWNRIDQPDRSEQDDLEMLLLAAASTWHWTQRPDCTNRNRSVGYWQISRVLSLMGHADLATRFGEACREAAPEGDLFCQGYACEALARAAAVAGDHVAAQRLLEEAKAFASGIQDQEEQETLLADLHTI